MNNAKHKNIANHANFLKQTYFPKSLSLKACSSYGLLLKYCKLNFTGSLRETVLYIKGCQLI